MIKKINESILLSLYSKMYLIRKAEETIISLYSEDDMKTPMHMSMGQEATPSAVAQAFGNRAQIVSTYRSHAPFLAHTGNIQNFFCELYGKVNGTARGRGGSMHLADIKAGYICSTAIVGAGLPMSAGIAFAEKQKKTKKIAIVYFGDGALDEGCFWETLNLCSLMSLPVLFVCEDNNYAVHTPKNQRQGFKSLGKIIEQFHCEYLFDDSNNVEKIYLLAKAAKDYIDQKSKPAFLHVNCYRYLEHVGINSDFEGGYRSVEDAKNWFASDSLKITREKLFHFGKTDEVGEIEIEILQKIDIAISLAKVSETPSGCELLNGVYYD